MISHLPRIVLAWACSLLSCPAEDTATATTTQRIAARTFPSIFQAWNNATPRAPADAAKMQALHDLVFVHPSMVGLRAETSFEGLAFTFTPESLAKAKAKRATLLAQNPQLVLLAEVRYRDAPPGFIPESSAWWKRDDQNKYVIGWAEGNYRLLDVAHTEWQDQVAKRAQAVMATGVFDGIMLDWWIDDASRLSLIRRVRETIGPEALVLANANDRTIPLTAEYVNGLFMECYRTKSPEDWKRISETLRWAESKLRTPRINCLEAWYHKSRADMHLMRAVTTLSLTQSDGYCLFSDPNDLPTSDHLHDWYDFWDKGLGRSTQPGTTRADGAWERAFTNGTVIYNPAGGSNIKVSFPSPHRSKATGLQQTEHTVPSSDGDIFYKE